MSCILQKNNIQTMRNYQMDDFFSKTLLFRIQLKSIRNYNFIQLIFQRVKSDELLAS